MANIIYRGLLACIILTVDSLLVNQPSTSKVFLLVMDGFVHNYENFTSNMPNFDRLSKEGVKGKGLIPPFPSVTWSSMNTLSTGLYPESHGIINNDFFDEKGKIMFHWKGDIESRESNSRFFTQEPIWMSNQKQKGSSSVYYWPGYYSFPVKPKYRNKILTPFGANIQTGREAIDETISHMESDPSLNFMVVYVDAPDETGHEHGVTSQEYKDRLEAMDKYVLGHLMKRLESYPDINLVVVADHGMIDLDLNHVYYLSDYLTDGTYFGDPKCSSICSVKPKNGHTASELVEQLKPLLSTGGFRVFNQKDTKMQFPPHLHYTHHKLIPPILILPNPGWIIYDKRMNLTALGRKPKLGSHGYDPTSCIEMNTIFFARGPAFKKSVTIEPFESVNIYPLLAHLLGIKARPNNGSLSTFKHILVDWNPTEKNELHGQFSYKVYALIFAGGILACLVVLTAFYFAMIRCYLFICRRKVRYSRMNYRTGFD